MSRLLTLVVAILVTGVLPSQTLAFQSRTITPAIPDQQIQVMAVVNGQEVSRQTLGNEAMRRFGEMVLESMINNQLIMEQCDAQGIRVTPQDIQTELDRRAGKFKMSTEAYIDLIARERGVDERKLRDEVIWTELALRRLAASQIEVDPEQIQGRMDSEFGPKVQVRVIALDDPEKARQVREAARANPEQFSRLAIDYSVDPNSASVGGLLPPLRRNMGEPELEAAAFGLNIGEISEIVPLADQFLILKCERQYPASELTEEQAVMMRQRITEELREEQLGNAAAGLFETMQEQSQIVNVINDPQLSQQMPGVAATVNGRQVTLDQVKEECLKTFGTDVLKSEINRMLIRQRLQQEGLAVSDDDLQFEINRAAVEFGFVAEDGTADMNRWIARVTGNDSSKIEIYVQDEVWPTVAMKKIVGKQVQVTDEDLQKGFQANYGPRVQCLAIVLQDQRTAQRVWEMAKANQSEQYFGELAHQYSVEPASRANYGEVPPIQKFGGQQILEDQAFGLKPGEISGLIPIGKNWVILWCKGHTTPVVQNFDDVRDELYKDILEKKMRIAMAEEFERITTTAQIDNFLEGSSQPGSDAVEAARNAPAGPARNP